MRIGFLFNHDQIHQIAHSLPIGVALAQLTDAEIIFATSSQAATNEVRRLAGALIGSRIRLVELSVTRRSSRIVAALLNRLLPARKLLIYRDNLAFFRSLDALVVTEKTSLVLKSRYGMTALKIIHTRHGAGDRAVGFNRTSAEFDHILVSGEKIQSRLVTETGADNRKISIVGYPKFDLATQPTVLSALDDDRPIVLYNPHATPHLSSWYKMGRAVLDWFAEHPEYRLIFAPHVMLFERPLVISIDPLAFGWPGKISKRHLSAENIHIDLGSRACTTMSYTDRADIYIGDVSSQVYEFLRTPRPCLFLDANGVTDWANDRNFIHWQAGPVISEVGRLGEGLEQAIETHGSHFAKVQKLLFQNSFDIDPKMLSSERAARVIASVSHIPVSSHAHVDMSKRVLLDAVDHLHKYPERGRSFRPSRERQQQAMRFNLSRGRD